MAEARWAYDGSAQGGKKAAFGNTWVIAAVVVKLPCCPSPVALPVLFRLWRGSFKGTPGQLALMREPDSKKLYDLGIFTLGTGLTAAAAIERYSWRWPIEPSNAAGKQVTGAGDACNRVTRAVERTVPFAFLIQSLMICWYAISRDPAAGLDERRQRNPWYRPKATPAAADMHAALRDGLTSARINGISPGCGEARKITGSTVTSNAQAA